MLHAVPSALSKNKDLAAMYARNWNRYVSPGEAVYAYQGEGERLLDRARRSDAVPHGMIREEGVFL